MHTSPPNKPAAPNAVIASQLTIEHGWPGGVELIVLGRTRVCTMKRLRLALLPLLFTAFVACNRPQSAPTHKADVTCYIGQLDSGSKCSGSTTSPGDPLGINGSLRCGLNKEIAITKWSFLESRSGKDIYQFTRSFEVDPPTPTNQTKQIQFDGTRVIVFENRGQVVVIQAPKP